jgi:two-component system sensor histidine kinase/response regulator
MTKILVIEDQNDLRDDIIEMLTLEGFDVAGADNGVVGVQEAKHFQPDVIVCDIMMPELDGYGVLEQIRKVEGLALIPFIFLTAKTDRMNMRHGMVLGADDYLTKPFVVTELLDSIYSQLKKHADLNAAINTRLEQLRESIITALPHELRTPLNTIIGFSEMLEMEATQVTPEQITDWAGHIGVAAQQLYRLVENYLYYVNLQVAQYSNHVLHEYEDAVSYDALLLIEGQSAKSMQRYGRGDDLQLNLEPIPPIHVGQRALVKIVDELLDNANKFSPSETPVRVSGAINGNYYRICIEDEGRGITQKQIENIGAYMQFDRWFYEQQGMGLGLALVKRLVELHEGELHILPLHKGTRACVDLQIVTG